MKFLKFLLSLLFKSNNKSLENIEEKKEMINDYALKLRLERYYLGPNDTLSNLYIEYPDRKELVCQVVEDKVRNALGTPDDMFDKVYGKTAIPYGTYQVIMSYSNRFKKQLPELLDVPNFSGVRIHSGNTHEDTEGCLIVGNNPKPSDTKSWVYNSKVTLSKVIEIIQTGLEKGKVIIEVTNA